MDEPAEFTGEQAVPARAGSVVVAEREEQVDEAFGGRLRFVVGQPDPLVRSMNTYSGRSAAGTSKSRPTTGMSSARAAFTEARAIPGAAGR